MELGSGGSLRAAWFGLVNGSLPQSNVGGEYTGLLAASAANPEEDMEVVADYKGIVTAVANQRGACGRERLYAGTCRQAFGNRAGKITSRHVRAHQQVPEWKDNEPEIADIWGNDRADQWAKAGAALAWLTMQTYADEAEKIIKNQRIYLTFVARRLARWAALAEDKPEWAKQTRTLSGPRFGPNPRPHLWRIHQGTWRCGLCQVKVDNPHTITAWRSCRRIPAIWAL